MAIARKPNSKPKSPMDEAAADAFIAGAAKPKAEPIATEADEAGQGAEPRKSPGLLRFDRALMAKVDAAAKRSEEHTSELQSLMRISYAVFCLKKKKRRDKHNDNHIRNNT